MISCGIICIVPATKEIVDLSCLSGERVIHLKHELSAKNIEEFTNTLFRDKKYIGSDDWKTTFAAIYNPLIRLRPNGFYYDDDHKCILVGDPDTTPKHNYMVCNIVSNPSLLYLLFRFGISRYDYDKYVMLVSQSLIYRDNDYHDMDDDDEDENTYIQNQINSNHGYLHFIFFNHNKHFRIELKGNQFISLTINYNLVNFDEPIPFAKTMPTYAPLLQYKKKDGTIHVDCILTCSFHRDTRQMYESTPKHAKFTATTFKIMEMVLSPSLLFCSIQSFDRSMYDQMNENYESLNIDKFKHANLNSEVPNQDESILPDIKLQETITTIKRMMLLDEILFEQYSRIINATLDTNEEKNDTLKQFLNEYRICGPKKGNLPDLTDLINYWDGMYNMKIKNLSNDLMLRFNEYVCTNIISFVQLMEINVIRNILIRLKSNVNCWELQKIITSLDDINYFNTFLISNTIYMYELIFMLQNDYIYSQKQMKKYIKIRNDMTTENKILKLHQFMMGRGKTSVFTPLLAFGIKIVKDKQPTIITSSHLVTDTNKYLAMMNFYSDDLDTNVFSVDMAKQRWLQKTDKNYHEIIGNVQDIDDNANQINEPENTKDIIEVNINNEWNIIDEFDSHYIYNKSVFNITRGGIEISDIVILCVYIYYITRGGVRFRYDRIAGVVDLNKFYDELKLAYDQGLKMTYNMDYGPNPKKPFSRLCIPYSCKDKPMTQSNFSNILLSIILTFKTYEDQNRGKLSADDIKQILENDVLFVQMSKIKYDPAIYEEGIDGKSYKYFSESSTNHAIDQFIDILDMVKLSTACDEGKLADAVIQYNKIDNAMAHQFIIFYFIKSINQNPKYRIKITRDQLNMSFQDIIYNTYDQMQFAYTGTAYMKLNSYADNEKYVFSNDVEKDPEEDVEVKLAICRYGCPNDVPRTNNINMITINNSNPTDANTIDFRTIDTEPIIRQIIETLGSHGQHPRGIVDLAGIFVNHPNNNIAMVISYIMSEMQYNIRPKKYHDIIYLDGDVAVKLTYDATGDKQPYTDPDPMKESIYYYDQGHTVGTDIRQPQYGHFGIIVTEHTRMTDFAQAIFRFRKLNRGTYMSIFMIGNVINRSLHSFYRRLMDNEQLFNDNQEYGLQYQLMKTMVRKISKDYQETVLLPEFITGAITDDQLIGRLHTNTVGLGDILAEIEKKISIVGTPDDRQLIVQKIGKIYKELIKDTNRPKLRSIMMGSRDDTQTNTQREKKTDKEVKQESKVQMDSETETSSPAQLFIAPAEDFVKTLRNETTRSICVVYHDNCTGCVDKIATKLFNDEGCNDYVINSKCVYISYNFLLNRELHGAVSSNRGINSREMIVNILMFQGDRWCFVEFAHIILIEIEWAAINYYADVLPVYDFRGNKINPSVKGIPHLKIDNTLRRMFGISGPRIRTPTNVANAVACLTMCAKILLKFNFASATQKRYNLSKELVRILDHITLDSLVADTINALKGRPSECDPSTDVKEYFKCMFRYTVLKLPRPIQSTHRSESLIKNMMVKCGSVWSIDSKTCEGASDILFDRIYTKYESAFRVAATDMVSSGEQPMSHKEQPMSRGEQPMSHGEHPMSHGGFRLFQTNQYFMNKKKYMRIMQLF